MPGPAAGRPPSRRSTASPCPGRMYRASIGSSRASEASACWLSALKFGKSCGPVEPLITLSVTNASPTKITFRDGRWSAALPAVCPGTWITRGDPGTSSVAPSPKVETSAIGVVRSPPATKAEPQEREQRDRPDLAAALVLRLGLAARERGIGLVDGDRLAVLAADPLGEADVVAVGMGQEDGAARRRCVRPIAESSARRSPR